MTCPTCGGSGQVYIPAGKSYQTCGRCGGAGQIPDPPKGR